MDIVFLTEIYLGQIGCLYQGYGKEDVRFNVGVGGKGEGGCWIWVGREIG